MVARDPRIGDVMIYDIWGSLKIRGPPNSTVDDNCPSSNGPLVTYTPFSETPMSYYGSGWANVNECPINYWSSPRNVPRLTGSMLVGYNVRPPRYKFV